MNNSLLTRWRLLRSKDPHLERDVRAVLRRVVLARAVVERQQRDGAQAVGAAELQRRAVRAVQRRGSALEEGLAAVPW